MKRLFEAFDKQTGLVSEFVRRARGYQDPPPPPKKWYQKLWWFILGIFGIVEKPKPKPWYPKTFAEVSVAFNQWRTGVWNYNRYMRGLRNKRFPFGDRIGRFEIRKWIEAKYGTIDTIDS